MFLSLQPNTANESLTTLYFSSLGLVVQLVRMPPCHGGGRGFESRPVRKMSHKALQINHLQRFLF